MPATLYKNVRCFGTNGWQSRWLWAEATHHSSRGQGSATVIREEVVNEPHDALRGLTTPPPGERLGILAEPGPQRSDRSLRRGTACRLSPCPLWRGSAGEAVDGAALAFLTSRALAAQKAEEELEQARARKLEERRRRHSVRMARLTCVTQ